MTERDGDDAKGSKLDWQRSVLACQIGAADTAVALALSIHADDADLTASPGVRQLAHELKMSEQTVRRSLGELRDLHLIIRIESGSTAKIRAQPGHWMGDQSHEAWRRQQPGPLRLLITCRRAPYQPWYLLYELPCEPPVETTVA